MELIVTWILKLDMMKLRFLYFLITFAIAALCFNSYANDCIFTVSGNQLIPMCDSDISLKKEILTINLKDDGFAYIDVYYELENKGEDKVLQMGFEAQPLDFDKSPFSPLTGDPYIQSFSVKMNNEDLPYSIKVMGGTHFDPNSETIWDYTYVYLFDALFTHGKNVVCHKYKYEVSHSVINVFDIAYKLTPATKWANGMIDDFTLVIKAEHTSKHFFIEEDILQNSDFVISHGDGKIRKQKSDKYGKIIEVTLRNGSVSYHQKKFVPKKELAILSADRLVSEVHKASYKLGSYYDRSMGYLTTLKIHEESFNTKLNAKILRSLPYASRGYVFKDTNLQKFYNAQWWYIPNKNYKNNKKDFTPSEEVILKGQVR